MPQIKNQSVTSLKVGKIISPSDLAASLEPETTSKDDAIQEPTDATDAPQSVEASKPTKS
jgi:hypothetical protein